MYVYIRIITNYPTVKAKFVREFKLEIGFKSSKFSKEFSLKL